MRLRAVSRAGSMPAAAAEGLAAFPGCHEKVPGNKPLAAFTRPRAKSCCGWCVWAGELGSAFHNAPASVIGRGGEGDKGRERERERRRGGEAALWARPSVLAASEEQARSGSSSADDLAGSLSLPCVRAVTSCLLRNRRAWLQTCQVYVFVSSTCNPPVCFPKPYLDNTTIYTSTDKTNAPNLSCNCIFEAFLSSLARQSALRATTRGYESACRLTVFIHTKSMWTQHHKPFHTSHEIIQPNNYPLLWIPLVWINCG